MPGGAPLSIACGNGIQSAKNSALATLSYLGVKDKFYRKKLAEFYKTEEIGINTQKINIYAKKYLKEIQNQFKEFDYASFEEKKSFDDILNNSLLSIVELCNENELKNFENWLEKNQNKHLNPILVYACDLNDELMINFHSKFLNTFDTHTTFISFEKAGAINAVLMALRIIANGEKDLSEKLKDFAKTQSNKVLSTCNEFKY
jgi:hypothetical protein